MTKPQMYQKLFSRDFCLPSVEAWVRGESTNPKQWTEEKQPFLPYIITERADDTVHFYYDLSGVEWVTNLLSKLAHDDRRFLDRIERNVLRKLTFIRPIYEQQKILGLSDLRRFISELEAGYPWFEAMWWFCQMEESKLLGLNLENIQKVRALTDILCNSSDTVIRKSLARLYPQLGDLSAVLSTSEIKTSKIPSQQVLEARDSGYFFANNQLFEGLTKSEIAKTLSISFTSETVTKVRQLTGSTAYRGIVRGFVRKVMGHKQIDKVQVGEILVSPMTMPDFIPAMKKAAAIVTDEGGMLSHAAIVAREFKKPSVVGTGFATKRFTDWDIVEVNANKGKVTLICHAAIVANKLKKPCIVATKFATHLFQDGDYVEVDADRGTITLINKHDRLGIRKILPWERLFQ